MSDAAIAIDMMAIPIVLKRLLPGAYSVTGDWVEGGPSQINIMAVIQPASGRQLMDVEEGLRAEARWICWTRAELRLDDQIVHKTKTYRVMVVWPRDEGVFHRAALGLLPE